MRKVLCVTLIALAGQPINPVYATWVSGNELFSRCGIDPNGQCLTYVLGVVDTLLTLQDAIPHSGCISIPTGVTAGQLRDIVVAYLRVHPETRHYSAASEVSLAILQTFPCK